MKPRKPRGLAPFTVQDSQRPQSLSHRQARKLEWGCSLRRSLRAASDELHALTRDKRLLWPLTFLRIPNRTSVFRLRSCASSMIITLYLSRSSLTRVSRRSIPGRRGNMANVMHAAAGARDGKGWQALQGLGHLQVTGQASPSVMYLMIVSEEVQSSNRIE